MEMYRSIGLVTDGGEDSAQGQWRWEADIAYLVLGAMHDTRKTAGFADTTTTLLGMFTVQYPRVPRSVDR